MSCTGKGCRRERCEESGTCIYRSRDGQAQAKQTAKINKGCIVYVISGTENKFPGYARVPPLHTVRDKFSF